MKIRHDKANDYDAMLVAMDKMLAEQGTHGIAMIIQLCVLMDQECLEHTVQQANDRWTFETGKKEHEELLVLLEDQLKQKRSKKNGC